MTELKDNEIWYTGAYSASLDLFIPHFVINELHPKGRRTRDKRQAEIWAQEDADHFNQDPTSNAQDWQPQVMPGEDIFIDDTGA